MSDIRQLTLLCQEERKRYHRTGETASPSCMELFRHAFTGNETAWTAIQSTFEPLIEKWIGVQSRLEVEDVRQDAWLAFFRHAPRIPRLVSTDQLGPVLEYLKKCTKSAILMVVRRSRQESDLYAGEIFDHAVQVQLRLDIQKCLDRLLETDEERQICTWRFIYGMSPRQIVEEYSSEYPDIQDVYQIIQRLSRRFRRDPELRQLGVNYISARRKTDSNASLEFRLFEQPDMQEEKNVTEECHLNEAILLDYITGIATEYDRRVVEASPACMQVAQQLADEILPLLSLFYRTTCPDTARLIDYQERTLIGADYLVIERHVAECPHCQAEITILSDIDEVKLNAGTNPLHRFVEAFLATPTQLPQPVRGQMLRYETPQIAIILSKRKAVGKPRTWTLRGQLRTPDGQLFTDVEDILLQYTTDVDRTFHASLADSGSFTFQELAEGTYRLRVLTAEEEIMRFGRL